MAAELETAAAGSAAEAKPATLFRVVTTPKLVKTGRCSFMFMFKGGMPRDWVGNTPYGFAWLEPKGDDYLNPFELGNKWAGRPHGQIFGDDGTARWAVHIFEGGRGEILSCGFDDSADMGGWRHLAPDLPQSSVFCMERALFDRLEPVLAEMGVVVEAHHFDGELATN